MTALRLMREKKMTRAGSARINEAKKNGQWTKAYTLRQDMPIPADLRRSLLEDKKAWANFKGFAKGYQNQYILWVDDAKMPATRKRRIRVVVKRARKGLKPGMV
jgi:uncharacterized protein YdeI (YjbR/CyaY-like superfamily)